MGRSVAGKDATEVRSDPHAAGEVATEAERANADKADERGAGAAEECRADVVEHLTVAAGARVCSEGGGKRSDELGIVSLS